MDPTRGGAAAAQSPPYNIIPIHNLLVNHPSLNFPEVRAAMDALKAVGDLRKPPFVRWSQEMDILDWLGLFFGFQADSVRNQREHLVLLLSNAQMRLHPAPDPINVLSDAVVRSLRRRLLRNYTLWCSFLRIPSNVWINEETSLARRASTASDPRRELLYCALYLLIWGEAANVRFVPECLCYIFHHLAMELNRILEGYTDESTGAAANPAVSGEDAFLRQVITPLYNVVASEAAASCNGTAPHSAWRNYDDINEYFWDRDCLTRLGWPMDLSKGFFAAPPAGHRVGKTGFVERRTFWNLFRSFDRLWVVLVLFLQAATIVAWDVRYAYPWDALRKEKDVRVRVLTVFITWAGMRFLQAVLDVATQGSLVSRERPWVLVRMLLKLMAAAAWTFAFGILYSRIWVRGRPNDDRVNNLLLAAAVFVSPEVVALVLLLVPWLSNLVDRSNWRVFTVLTWWFQSRTFVGRGLREGIVDSALYSVFWVVVLAVKFTFSYFLQIKPLVKPTKGILNLREVKYEWFQFFRRENRLGVGLLWLPVLLIYLMDIQIWYSIASAVVGALVGLFAHLGEIRNVQQLRLRFQFFAGAMQFNLMPEEQLLQPHRPFKTRFHDWLHRLKLRYGLGRPYQKIESTQLETNRFMLLWNEIIESFREEDIISDEEMELLEIPGRAWGVSVIRWPCFLLCNELQLALLQANQVKLRDKDKTLWRRICKNEYRRCAVIEAYDSVKFLLLGIVKRNTEEYSIVTNLFFAYEDAIRVGKFIEEFKTSVLPSLHAKLVSLTGLLIKPKVDMAKLVNTLQTLYDIARRDFPKIDRTNEELARIGWIPSRPDTNILLFEDAITLPPPDDEVFYKQLRRLHTILNSRDSMNNVPQNLEARRRIAFFSNSLFMNMPRAPQVEKMQAFSVLTPYYSEEVMYTMDQIEKPNEDGISILYYLQKIYPDEWKNFIQRMKREEKIANEKQVLKEKRREVREWASYRGQTLSRTVRGMMYYYRALKLLAFLDTASEMDVHGGSTELVAVGSDRELGSSGAMGRASSSRNLSRTNSGETGGNFREDQVFGTVLMKFTYVVACQIYGSQKAKKEPQAEEILNLMKNNETLRVAYVDEVKGRAGNEYYSVLVKYDTELEKEVEVYRVRLPGPLKLGEGKPENQNHAIIFTRGNSVQTIDMNQDNYFEEALKMRNLLEEFTRKYGARKPTILGVREHIFTGSVSSLAWFMSAQETSFVTLGQRVLANPLKVRMHYGHPDVFDRVWFLTRGGISKASRVINISEDIFAGFNCTLRGGNVTHHEYIQVGKGRDVGLNQISMFEAKVASGNGEQVSSRDVYRLGHRLDFFRMLSFYYSSVGFFFNSMMVILTVYAFVWGRLYLALSGLEGAIQSNANNNRALGAILNQQFIIQLGLFTALPMVVENSLEHGFLHAVWDFIKMQLQLASVFFTFSMGTKSHYFGRTVLHGGAKYRATGRGFVVQHKSFAENYRLYARSHFIRAIELGLVLAMYSSYSPLGKNTFVYIALTITSWFLILSWLLAPFAFNPSGFDWLKTYRDFEDFMNWIWYRGGVSIKSEMSWETWWYEEQDHLRTTGFWGKLMEIIVDLRYFFFQFGIVYQLKIAHGSHSIVVYLLSWIYLVIAIGVFVLVAYAQQRYSAKEHIYYRAVQSLIIICIVLAIVLLNQFTKFAVSDFFTSLLAIIPTGWGLISIALVFRPLLEKSTVIWETVASMARFYDILFGFIVMAPVVFLCWAPGFQSMQTRILFNEAFSRGLQFARIITGKKHIS